MHSQISTTMAEAGVEGRLSRGLEGALTELMSSQHLLWSPLQWGWDCEQEEQGQVIQVTSKWGWGGLVCPFLSGHGGVLSPANRAKLCSV